MWKFPSPCLQSGNSELKRKTARIALRYIFGQCSYRGCQLQGSKCSTEISTVAQQSTGISHSCSVFPNSRDWVKFKGVFRRPDQSGNSPHALQFSEMSGISTALHAAELKLQGLSLINCRRIFSSFLIHGRTV